MNRVQRFSTLPPRTVGSQRAPACGECQIADGFTWNTAQPQVMMAVYQAFEQLMFVRPGTCNNQLYGGCRGQLNAYWRLIYIDFNNAILTSMIVAIVATRR